MRFVVLFVVLAASPAAAQSQPPQAPVPPQAPPARPEFDAPKAVVKKAAPPVVVRQPVFNGVAPRPYAAGTDNHTHTCPHCRITWGGPGHGHTCRKCGRSVTIQDSPGVFRR